MMGCCSQCNGGAHATARKMSSQKPTSHTQSDTQTPKLAHGEPTHGSELVGPIGEPAREARARRTVPTPPRAAADRPRALGYMIWMRTIGT